MIILITILTVVFLLLIYSVNIVYEINLVNFDFSARLVLKLPFSKEIYNSSKTKKKSGDKAGKKSSGKKFKLKTVRELKEPVTVVLTEICKIIKRYCKITSVQNEVKLALEDPMENGIAYGIISGACNVISLVLKEKCSVKKVKLEILSDFNSGEGLIFKSCGTLKVRPLFIVFAVIFNRKLIESIKNILEILKREENDNG